MKKIISIVFLLQSLFLQAQDFNLKNEAIEQFKNENYPLAIHLMERAKKENPTDAEIYYYLGFFSHYLANDSRPLVGYDYQMSERIFAYLDKAIELNPKYGNAKYFYGAECSSNAFKAMQNYDSESLRKIYGKAFDIGAYPEWLLEFGRNMLANCGKNALLFTGGNADFDVCMYLQLHENYRTDISIMPIGNIDRPWYVKYIKEGIIPGFRKVNIELTDAQIYDMHPYKWDTTIVSIPVSEELILRYGLSASAEMEWEIVPDLSSDRNHSKIRGEKIQKRTYLSPQRAILLHIIESNKWERPICFSNMANPFFWGGLDAFFQNCGLVSRLMPFKTHETKWETDYHKLELWLSSENDFSDYCSVLEEDIPRISGLLNSYHIAVINLLEHYKNSGDKESLKKILRIYHKKLSIGKFPDIERYISSRFGIN